MSDFVFTVEAGHVQAFARALGEPDRTDDELTVPPTFLAAAEHRRPGSRLRPTPGERWRGSGAGPGSTSGSGGGSLHAEQHFDYHRPVVAGERLVVRDVGTRTWERPGRDGAVLHFTERTTAYLDPGDVAVVTERRVTVQRVAAGPTAHTEVDDG